MRKYTLKQLRGAFGAGAGGTVRNNPRNTRGLVNQWFLLMDDAGEWTGHAGAVVSNEGNGFYLLEYINELMGCCVSKLVHISELAKSYVFFEEKAEWAQQMTMYYRRHNEKVNNQLQDTREYAEQLREVAPKCPICGTPEGFSFGIGNCGCQG